MSAPDPTGASTTTVTSPSAAIVVSRCAKVHRWGGASGGNSEMSAPCERTACASRRRRPRASARYDVMPAPSTATVRPCASSAPACAALSTPCARPETTTIPASAHAEASSRVTRAPYGVMRRVPTMLTARAADASRSPSSHKGSGGQRRSRRRAGYRGSAGPMPITDRNGGAVRRRHPRHARRRFPQDRLRSARPVGRGDSRGRRAAAPGPLRREGSPFPNRPRRSA